MVFVINKNNKPLMPTNRHGHVRKLLKAGLAVPICNNPFTIKLKYDTTEYTQDLYLGVDVGRENIGFGVSKENGECVFMSELKTNNRSVKKAMDKRRAFRHARRHHARLRKQRKALKDGTAIKNGNDDTLRNKLCKSKEVSYPKMDKSITCKVIKGAEPQFANRKKRCELTPSARQLIQMHMLAIQKIMKFLPIKHIIIERNVFNFQKMENCNIRAWEYSKGVLYGYKDYKQYIHELQHGKCLLCDKPIEQYHHIIPKNRGGSNTASNIAGLCDACHNSASGVHKDSDMESRLQEMRPGLFQKYKVSLLNTVMPYLIEEMSGFCNKHDMSFATTQGYDTYRFRKEHGLKKRHCIDGYVISMAGRKVSVVKPADAVYLQQRFKKKSNNIISKLNSRTYSYNGKVVAVNRHKAEEQVADSLEEYMAAYAVEHSKEECFRHLWELTVKPARRTYTFHKNNTVCLFHAGDVIRYQKHNKIKGNTKSDVFIADVLKVSNNKIEFGTKSRDMKYCSVLDSSCIPYIRKDLA